VSFPASAAPPISSSASFAERNLAKVDAPCGPAFAEHRYEDALAACLQLAEQTAETRVVGTGTFDNSTRIHHTSALMLAARSASRVGKDEQFINSLLFDAILSERKTGIFNIVEVPEKCWVDLATLDACIGSERARAAAFYAAATPAQREVFLNYAYDKFDPAGIPCHVETFNASNYRQQTWWYCDSDKHYEHAYTFLNGVLRSDYKP